MIQAMIDLIRSQFPEFYVNHLTFQFYLYFSLLVKNIVVFGFAHHLTNNIFEKKVWQITSHALLLYL